MITRNISDPRNRLQREWVFSKESRLLSVCANCSSLIMLLAHPSLSELLHLDTLHCMEVVLEGLLVRHAEEAVVGMRIQGVYEKVALEEAQGTYGAGVATVGESASAVPGLDYQFWKPFEPGDLGEEYCQIGFL